MNLKVNVKTIGLPGTPALTEFVNDKVSYLEKFLEKEDEVLVDVEIGKITAHHKSGDVFKAQINVKTSGKYFHVEENSDDLYAAIDLAKDELLRQVRERHNKEHSRAVRSGRKLKDFLRGFKPWH